jgi:hypothetical protein
VAARPDVVTGPPARFDWRVETVTDTAGHRLSGGAGASGWGYNQSNLVRCDDDVYALSWRDDLTLCVYRRLPSGSWEPGPVLPPVPQNGNLLVDASQRLHVIGGKNASWHVRFDEPGSLDRYELRRRVRADSRFGAAIDADDRILVAGGLAQMGWYVLDGSADFQPVAEGRLEHEEQRGYHFVVFGDGAAHTLCSDDYFVTGERFPTQTITEPDPATGGTRTRQTPGGIYPVLKAYYYYNPDLLAAPDDWRCTVVSDVADTYHEASGARGTTDHQELFVDAEGLVHLTYYENRQPSTTVWAGRGQEAADSRLYHAVGPPGGPFQAWCLGAFNSGRLYQTPDGRLHYLLTRGLRAAAESVWYAVGDAGDGSRISEPVRLDGVGPLWHLFVNAVRAGGTRADVIDAYWTGPHGGNSNEVFYGCLRPG